MTPEELAELIELAKEDADLDYTRRINDPRQ